MNEPSIISHEGIEVQVFDLREEPIVLPPRKWNQHIKRDPKDAKGVCLHQWDTKVGTEPRNRQRFGEPLALAKRALKIPAHISLGATEISKTPIVSIAHPLERYCYHGDAANGSYLGIEVMGSFPFTEDRRSVHHTPLSPELQAAIAVGLQVASRLLIDWTSQSGPWELIAHRQACNSVGDHTECCGEGILSLACKVPSDFIPDPNKVLDEEWSLPWPQAWSRHIPLPAKPSLTIKIPKSDSPFGGEPPIV